jgi:hypothetical protein
MPIVHFPGNADTAPAELQLGRRYYREQRWGEAIEVLGLALTCVEPSETARHRGEALFLQGMAKLQLSDEAYAIDTVEASAAADWLEARFQLALNYARQGAAAVRCACVLLRISSNSWMPMQKTLLLPQGETASVLHSGACTPKEARRVTRGEPLPLFDVASR